MMNAESSVQNQYDLCSNSNLAGSEYSEYFGNTYDDTNCGYQNQFESEEVSQSSNGSNPLFNASSNNNAMVYETVTQHTRIHIPSYMGGLELYDTKQQTPCYYQDSNYSNCKYEPMLDYTMMPDKIASNQSFLGYNNMQYQEYPPRQSPQHLLHNNMFLEYCGSPVQSSSSDDDNNNNNNTLSDQTQSFLTGEQPYKCPDTRAVCHVPQKRRGKQLWKFLYQLLQDENYNKVICWSDNGKSQFEFKLLEPEEVATLWGKEKGKPNMNYDKLSRSLRFYYQKNLIQKVSGDHYVYKFPINPENLIKYIDTQSKRPKGGRVIRNSIESQRLQPYQMSPYAQGYSANYSCYDQTPGVPSQYYDVMPLPLSHEESLKMQVTYPSS